MKLVLMLLSIGLLQAADPLLYVRELTQIRNLLAAGEFQSALTAAKNLNKKAPDEIISYQLIATAELALGHYSDAERTLQWMLDLKIGRTDSTGWMLVAQFREATGDVDGAIEAVNQSFLRLVQGQDTEARKLLSYSAGLQLLAGKLNRAEAAAKEALKIVGPNDSLAAEILARVRIARNNPEQALTALRELSASTPNPRLLYLIAETSGLTADYAAFERAARLQAASSDNANRQLVFYLASKGADPAEAVRVARKETERRGDVHTRDALAVALFANGEKAEARTIMKTVLSVGTQDPEILAHAGMLGVKSE